jgi:hypothetical protein
MSQINRLNTHLCTWYNLAGFIVKSVAWFDGNEPKNIWIILEGKATCRLHRKSPNEKEKAEHLAAGVTWSLADSPGPVFWCEFYSMLTTCRLFLKGLCHQIRITWKWYWCKGLGMDMRRLKFKNFWSEPSIFNWHLKFLCLGSKRVQIFILFRT